MKSNGRKQNDNVDKPQLSKLSRETYASVCVTMSAEPPPEEDNIVQDTDVILQGLWSRAEQDISGIDPAAENWKKQNLPLARIKKIMKSEEDIMQEFLEGKKAAFEAKQSGKFMISAEAPLVVGKACELLIKEISARAWQHTERNRRRTLQRQDIHAAVGESEVFDFLIDIVPRVTTSRTPAVSAALDTNDFRLPQGAQPPQVQMPQPDMNVMNQQAASAQQTPDMSQMMQLPPPDFPGFAYNFAPPHQQQGQQLQPQQVQQQQMQQQQQHAQHDQQAQQLQQTQQQQQLQQAPQIQQIAPPDQPQQQQQQHVQHVPEPPTDDQLTWEQNDGLI